MELQKKLKFGQERRFTDDMSKIDIELQNQTQDISATEMRQEADSIKTQLQQRETPQIEQEQGEQK